MPAYSPIIGQMILFSSLAASLSIDYVLLHHYSSYNQSGENAERAIRIMAIALTALIAIRAITWIT
jgi:hypothetical protein